MALEPVYIKRNPRFKDVTYKFPVTVVKLEQPPIDLSEISDSDIENAAKKVTSTGDVLYRKEITIEEYINQKWGYLIAYEDDIAKSDSWDDVKTIAQPVSNIL